MTNNTDCPTEALKAENEQLKSELAALRKTFDEMLKYEKETAGLLNELPLGEIILDHNGNFLASNDKFANLLGYSQEELIGKNFAFTLYDGFGVYRETYPRFREAENQNNLNWKMRKKDGGVVYTALYPKPKFDPEGNFIYGRGYLIDVTERTVYLNALKMSESEKVLILQTMSESVIYFDKDMNVKWNNEKAARIIGVRSEDMVGRKCFAFCHINRNYCRFCPMNVAKTHLKVANDEININDTFQICMTAHPVFDEKGEFSGMVQMIKDITERKTLEKRLTDLANLERRKIGEDIHDGICQIMTGVVFMISALQSEMENSGDHRAKEVDNIAEHVKNAQNMLRSLVQGLCPVGVDPQGLINALENMTVSLGIIYKIRCDFHVHSSFTVTNYDAANHLYMIVQESITNAAKHSECSKVSVSIKLVKSTLKIIIADDGIGLPVDNTKSTGMGLRIMKNRALAIGAMLSIKSGKNKGTRITISLPEENLVKD